MQPIQDVIRSRPAIGGWFSGTGAVGAELMGRAGFDFVVVDVQHGAVTWDTLLPAVQALQLGGVPAVARVGWPDPAQVMRALDVGAKGVIVPMVETADQARLVADAMRYPPAGVRSYGPVRSVYGLSAQADQDVLCLPMIETAEGLANVAEIAATPGVDGLFVGPVDLSLALGLDRSDLTGNAKLNEAMDAIIAAADRHGRFVGTLGFGEAHARDLIRRGVRLITLGNDLGYLRAGIARDAAVAQLLTKDSNAE
ncbi:aldolase/citrate lyase family protein [Streptomyces sp. NPDC008092]|uniref:HpcH/HpaI aldolase family protein n=1 Tax=Streptomyces sp. NPDC008092 TaxID=3364808 RepID=UPI0036EAF8D6